MILKIYLPTKKQKREKKIGFSSGHFYFSIFFFALIQRNEPKKDENPKSQTDCTLISKHFILLKHFQNAPRIFFHQAERHNF